MASSEACSSPHNNLKEPTKAQAEVGNYKKARVTLHGLRLVIENPHGSVRRGVSGDGKAWESRMQAHYGEIAGTCGADGDPVDVFIGPFPESRRVWVINQSGPGAGFDEHKVVLGAATEQMARELYLASFDRDWAGLQSIVALSLDQLRWWLKHGDHAQPISLNQLPFDGTPSMQTTPWDSNAQPLIPMPKLMYGLRTEDAADGLLLDAVTLHELLSDPDIDVVSLLDALVVPVAAMAARMDQLQRVMKAVGTSLDVAGYTISDPVRLRGTMQVAVFFALSDGQAITVWFHNPDATPDKLTPMDELISWKWMLNKKDITITVAPERGRDLNPREVARRIMRLAEKNTEAFKKANAKLAEKMATLEALDGEIGVLEAQLTEVHEQIAEAKLRRDVEGDDLAAREADVTSPEGYAKIKDDEAALLKWQDLLDNVFQGRLIATRNALRDLGWVGEKFGALAKAGAKLKQSYVQVGAGRNLVGINYGVLLDGDAEVEATREIRDDLRMSPEGIAAELDAMVPAAQPGSEVQPKPSGDIAHPDPLPPSIPASPSAEAVAKAAELGAAALGRYAAPAQDSELLALIPVGAPIGWSGPLLTAWSDAFHAVNAEAQPAAPGAAAMAKVDAAYTFDSATDAFKLMVAPTVEKSDYSVFKSARVIDAAVKAAGGSVAWDVTSEGKLDSVSDDEDDTDPAAEFDAIPADDPAQVVLDGDFPGHPFRGNQYAKANAESGAAVRASIRAKHHEVKGNSKEARRAHQSAALTHKAAVIHAKGKAKGYHKKMAAFHEKRGAGQLDGVLDDSTATDPLLLALGAGNAIGTISNGGEIIGRAIIAGGDGKAMVYVGAAGGDRVKRSDSDYPFYFDEDDEEQEAMVHALFAALTKPAEEAAPVVNPEPPTNNDGDPTPSEEQVTPTPETAKESEVNEERAAGIRRQLEDEKTWVSQGDYSPTSVAETRSKAVIEYLGSNPDAAEQHAAELVRLWGARNQTQGNKEATGGGEPQPVEDASDRAYLQALIDGTGDLMAEDTFAKLEPMFAKYEGNAEMLALLEKAANAYGEAVTAEAQKALAAA